MKGLTFTEKFLVIAAITVFAVGSVIIQVLHEKRRWRLPDGREVSCSGVTELTSGAFILRKCSGDTSDYYVACGGILEELNSGEE